MKTGLEEELVGRLVRLRSFGDWIGQLATVSCTLVTDLSRKGHSAVRLLLDGHVNGRARRGR